MMKWKELRGTVRHAPSVEKEACLITVDAGRRLFLRCRGSRAEASISSGSSASEETRRRPRPSAVIKQAFLQTEGACDRAPVTPSISSC